MRCQYYWAFPVLGHMNALALPGSKVGSPVTWLMTSHSSPARRTRGAGLLVMEVGVLIVATCISMRSCPWRRLSHVLYLCSCSTLVVSAAFLCVAGGIGSVSYGMMWGTRWGVCLDARPGRNAMSPCGSILRGGTGAASVVASVVFTLGGGVSWVPNSRLDRKSES